LEKDVDVTQEESVHRKHSSILEVAASETNLADTIVDSEHENTRSVENFRNPCKKKPHPVTD